MDRATLTPTSNGWPFSRLVMGQKIASPTFALYFSGDTSNAGRRPFLFVTGLGVKVEPDYVPTLSEVAGYHASRPTGGRLEEFDEALRINPDSAFGHGNRGVALHALGRYEEAIAAARRSLEIDPDSEKSYFVSGLALVAAQRPGEEAAESLRRAGASIPRARVMAAGLLANMGSLPDAIAEIDAYLKSGNQEFQPMAQQWRDKWAAQQSAVRVYR